MSGKAKTIVFESVGDFLADACKGDHPDSHKRGDEDFHGTKTFKEAVALAKQGWPEGRERLESLRAELEATIRKAIEAKAATQVFDVVGDYIDVGRVLEGEPECCGSYLDDEGGHAKSRVVKIVANVSALGNVEQRQIFSLGAAIYAAIDLIALIVSSSNSRPQALAIARTLACSCFGLRLAPERISAISMTFGSAP